MRVGPGPLGGPWARDTKEGVREIGSPDCIDGCDFRVGPWPRDSKEGFREIGLPDCIEGCDFRVGPLIALMYVTLGWPLGPETPRKGLGRLAFLIALKDVTLGWAQGL